eukprot:g19246.t1
MSRLQLWRLWSVWCAGPSPRLVLLSVQGPLFQALRRARPHRPALRTPPSAGVARERDCVRSTAFRQVPAVRVLGGRERTRYHVWRGGVALPGRRRARARAPGGGAVLPPPPDVLEVSSRAGLRQPAHPDVTLRFRVTCHDAYQCRVAYTSVLVCTDRYTRRLAACGALAWAVLALCVVTVCAARRCRCGGVQEALRRSFTNERARAGSPATLQCPVAKRLCPAEVAGARDNGDSIPLSLTVQDCAALEEMRFCPEPGVRRVAGEGRRLSIHVQEYLPAPQDGPRGDLTLKLAGCPLLAQGGFSTGAGQGEGAGSAPGREREGRVVWLVAKPGQAPERGRGGDAGSLKGQARHRSPEGGWLLSYGPRAGVAVRGLIKFQVGDIVLLYHPQVPKGVSSKLFTHWKGPYQIMEQTGPLNYKIRGRVSVGICAEIALLLQSHKDTRVAFFPRTLETLNIFCKTTNTALKNLWPTLSMSFRFGFNSLSRLPLRTVGHRLLQKKLSARTTSRMSVSSARFSTAATAKKEPKEKVPLTFVLQDGEEVTVDANVGDSILQVAWDNDIELEGACESSLACSTCHIILPKDVYDKLPAIDDDEQDMLDMALGLTDTSRLGCQIHVTKDMAGIKVQLPDEVANMQNN